MLNQYCNVKLALIIESIFINNNITSLQIKVHECYLKPLKPRQSLLKIEDQSDDEVDDKVDDEVDDE